MSFSPLAFCFATATVLTPFAFSATEPTLGPDRLDQADPGTMLVWDPVARHPAREVAGAPTNPSGALVLDAAERRLAERVSRALEGNANRRASPRSVPSAPRASTAEPDEKALRWVCGNWQQLWQGHGRAKTCEWR